MANSTLARILLKSHELAAADDWGPSALAVNLELAELFADVPRVRLRLALCLLEAGTYESALAEFQRVVALAGPTSQEGRQAELKIRRLRAQLEATEELSFRAAQGRAVGLRGEARVEEALIWHDRAAELARTPAERSFALASWASTLRPLFRFEEAKGLLDQAIQIDPSRKTNKIAYTVLIAVLTDMQHVRAATQQAEALLREYPRDVHVLNAAGGAFMALARKSGDMNYRDRGNKCFALARHATDGSS